MEHKNIKDIAKEVRAELKKEFPACKFSVTIERYSGGQSLSVALTVAPVQVLSDEYLAENEGRAYFQVNNYYIEESVRLTEEGKVMLSKVNEISNRRNWDKSDMMTDYFNVNYYFQFAVGKWDKDFQIAA